MKAGFRFHKKIKKDVGGPEQKMACLKDPIASNLDDEIKQLDMKGDGVRQPLVSGEFFPVHMKYRT